MIYFGVSCKQKVIFVFYRVVWMSMPSAHNGQDQDIAIKNHSLCIFTVENHVDLVDLNQVLMPWPWLKVR